MNKYDVIIIGAGVVGAAVARALSRYDLQVLWIEKQSDVCMGTSCANSAVIHAGYDATPGTLKAQTNVVGCRMWPEIAQQLDIPFKQTGSYVVAQNDDDMEQLKKLRERGVQNRVEGLEIVAGQQLCKAEPALNPHLRGALWAASTGVIDPFAAVLGLAENAVSNGVELKLETAFEDFLIKQQSLQGIVTNRGDFKCDRIINCAGLYSDEVMHKAGVHPEVEIHPRRGEYLVFDPIHIRLGSVYFPIPSNKGKGILVSTTTHGNVLAGPNSWFVSDRENTETTAEGLREVFDHAKQMVPSLDFSAVIAAYSGLRATGNFGPDKDFLIEMSDRVSGLINVCGIESPGFAAAPAIAEKVVTFLNEKKELKKKQDFNPIRRKRPSFRDMNYCQRAKLVRENPAYGRIVCRCEYVTEGEILDAIHGIIPARTYDAIKRRTWLGTGRCQGGFDYSRTIEILSRELGVPAEAITKKGVGSEFIYRMTKDVV